MFCPTNLLLPIKQTCSFSCRHFPKTKWFSCLRYARAWDLYKLICSFQLPPLFSIIFLFPTHSWFWWLHANVVLVFESVHFFLKIRAISRRTIQISTKELRDNSLIRWKAPRGLSFFDLNSRVQFSNFRISWKGNMPASRSTAENIVSCFSLFKNVLGWGNLKNLSRKRLYSGLKQTRITKQVNAIEK